MIYADSCLWTVNFIHFIFKNLQNSFILVSLIRITYADAHTLNLFTGVNFEHKQKKMKTKNASKRERTQTMKKRNDSKTERCEMN